MRTYKSGVRGFGAETPRVLGEATGQTDPPPLSFILSAGFLSPLAAFGRPIWSSSLGRTLVRNLVRPARARRRLQPRPLRQQSARQHLPTTWP